MRNISQYAQALCNLPKIRYLSIISHGFNTERALRSIAQIKKICEKANVKFHVSISLDGIYEVHNRVRNVPDVFKKHSPRSHQLSVIRACTVILLTLHVRL